MSSGFVIEFKVGKNSVFIVPERVDRIGPHPANTSKSEIISGGRADKVPHSPRAIVEAMGFKVIDGDAVASAYDKSSATLKPEKSEKSEAEKVAPDKSMKPLTAKNTVAM